MKSILLSIKPEWVAKILNQEKAIEVRKLFPKDYVGWVYIYCSKGNKPLFYYGYGDKTYSFHTKQKDANDIQHELNGKVVARFWCDKVEELYIRWGWGWVTNTIKGDLTIEEKTCVSRCALFDYLGNKGGYAIHISKLEIFDRPRELIEFTSGFNRYKVPLPNGDFYYHESWDKPLFKAPQNYCYIEGE